MAGSRDVVGEKKYHEIVCTVKVGKVIEYESSICNTSSDTTIQKSKKVNLPASAVLVLIDLFIYSDHIIPNAVQSSCLFN